MIKYLYIDDRKDGGQSVQNFPIKGKVEFDIIQPTEKRKDIFDCIKNYDGLMVDQQLDEIRIDGKFYSDYLGSSLAMDIRTKENEIKKNKGEDISIPIILYSANKNVPDVLSNLGKDILDLRIYKTDKHYMKRIPEYQSKILSLAEGYKNLKNASSVCDCLRFGDNLDKIDNRFIDELRRLENQTAHSKASFILNELIINQGILIDEDILAVRLGIDKKKSKDGWIRVLESLKKNYANYYGVFCDGWPRWWMPMVEEWWYNIINNDKYIRFYDAERRAEIISKELGVELVPAKAESKYSIHKEYWTVCDFSKEPLDVEDGLMLPGQENLYPWQDARYVSIYSALEESIDVAESDKERLNDLKSE